MFGFFGKKETMKCPVKEAEREWIEEAFVFLLGLFGREATANGKVFVPSSADFPIQYDGSEKSAYETLRIIAQRMEIPIENIVLEFYDDDEKEINTGGLGGNSVFVRSTDNSSNPAGLYWGEEPDGKYYISLNRSSLRLPESMAATLAHELAHVKLLGENRIEENDEKLTDLTTLIFGFGIFNANDAFRTFNDGRSYGWRSVGYLSQMEWGYALALYAIFRNETKPSWASHLCRNINMDFKNATNFILHHGYQFDY